MCKEHEKSKQAPLRRIAVIEDGYIRDAQLFTGDPGIVACEPDLDNYYCDIKYPHIYVGLFTGTSEKEIRDEAAADIGVHPDIISLINPSDTAKRVIVGRAINGITINGLEFLLDKDGEVMEFPCVEAAKRHLQENGVSQEEIEDLRFLDADSSELVSENSDYICPICENEEHRLDAKFCKICGAALTLPLLENGVSGAEIFTFERLRAHVSHNIEVVVYGDDANVAVECMDCCEVLYSVDNPSGSKK